MATVGRKLNPEKADVLVANLVGYGFRAVVVEDWSQPIPFAVVVPVEEIERALSTCRLEKW